MLGTGKNVKKKKKENQFENLRRKLAGMRQDLISESKAEIGQILHGEDKYSGVSDDGDLADIAFRDAMQGAKLTRQQNLLKVVQEALRRIDEGSYGICEDCGEEIPVGRLTAMPFALRCVECQEQHEIKSSEYAEVTQSSGAPEEDRPD